MQQLAPRLFRRLANDVPHAVRRVAAASAGLIRRRLGVAGDDAHPVERYAEYLARNLSDERPLAAPLIRYAAQDRDAAIDVDLHRRGAVHGRRVGVQRPEAKGHADALVWLLRPELSTHPGAGTVDHFVEARVVEDA